MRDLERLGVSFDADRHGNLALGLEGGHSRRRIVHAGGSATGRRITRELSALAAVDERIEVLEPRAATSLTTHDGRCVGLVARPRRGDALPVLARAVVLATGGMAALWQRSTNPRGAVGAGLLLAHAAGAELADLEFMQFHPTALRHDGPRDGFLITEAVRGEGATLHDARRRALRRRAGAARPGGARDRGASSSAAAGRRCSLDMRAVDVARFPNIAAALEEVGHRPAPRPGAGRPRRALHDGRRGHRPRRALVAGRPVRGRRVGLHRPPRRQPAGLELARGVLRVRRAAPRSRPSPTPQPPAAARARRRDPHGAALRRDARPRCGATRGCSASRPACAELLDDPFPLARLIAASCLAREESRGAHQRTDHPDTDPAARPHAYACRSGGAQPRFELWT